MQGHSLKCVSEVKHIRGSFHKEAFKYNDVSPIVNWGMVGRPFLRGWEHLDEDEKKPLSALTHNSGVNYHKGKAFYISESGLYSLILRSKLPAEKSSKKRVTVMPGLKEQNERMSSRLPGRSIATDPQIVKAKSFGAWEW